MLKIALIAKNYVILLKNKNKTEKEIEELKKELISELKKRSDKKYSILSDANVISFRLITRNNILYDIDKMKKKLTKKQRKQLITKNVKVVDYEGFAEIMKKHGVRFEEIRDYIKVEEKVSTEKLKNMFDAGEIDLQKISDCYEIISSDYLKTVGIDE